MVTVSGLTPKTANEVLRDLGTYFRANRIHTTEYEDHLKRVDDHLKKLQSALTSNRWKEVRALRDDKPRWKVGHNRYDVPTYSELKSLLQALSWELLERELKNDRKEVFDEVVRRYKKNRAQRSSS